MQIITRANLFDRRHEVALDAAMFHVANLLSDTLATDTGRDVETLDDADVIAAMRQPVSLASAYHDLCERLGIQTPRAVRLALN